MLRSVVLGVANSRAVRRIVTGGLGRRVALRFVAGEELDDAIRVVHELNAQGFDVSLDHLGENVADVRQAEAAADVYLRALDRIEGGRLRANISVKLTQLGLDLSPDPSAEMLNKIVARAAAAGTTVTLDMEDHRTTDRTLDACMTLAVAHPGRVGVAIQAYLRRTPDDLARLAPADAQVRLCKGAYREPRAIAYRRRREVDAAYASLAVALFGSRAYPMIATHDDRLVSHAKRQAAALRRPRDSFEFQMLYGVRRELQRSLVEQGYRVRVYVPFGSQWYPYLMRRIAERPANVRFFAEAMLRG